MANQIICTECGCPYDINSTHCPECGCPNKKVKATGNGFASVCPYCGAPNSGYKICQYCDSAIPYVGGTKVVVNNNNNQGGISAGVAAFGGALLGSLFGDL